MNYNWGKKKQLYIERLFLPGEPLDRGAWLATVCEVTEELDIATKQQITRLPSTVSATLSFLYSYHIF